MRTLSAGATPSGVGMAFGGTVEVDGTMRADSTNLVNLVNLPLADTFSDLLGLPCRADHDGRASMRGEAWTGAARGRRNAMIVTLRQPESEPGCFLTGTSTMARVLPVERSGFAGLTPPPATGEWLTLEEVAAPGRFAARHGCRVRGPVR